MKKWGGIAAIFAVGVLIGGVLVNSWWTSSPPPVPAAASAKIRQAIDQAGLPNVAFRRQIRPSTEGQWRSLIAAREANDRENPSLEQISRELQVNIQAQSIAGVPVYRVTPASRAGLPAGPSDTPLFIYLHGGAYVFSSGEAAVGEAPDIARYSGVEVLAIDYAMPPDHPYPAALDQVEQVYRELLKSHSPQNIAMGGISAGAGLSMAAVQRFKSRGLPVPAALYLGTPWADLSKTGDSLYTLEGLDRILVTYDGVLAAAAELYAGGTDLLDSGLSPVYGEFAGFPPSYLVTGTRDLFLSDTSRVHRKMREAGVNAELNVYEGLSHAEYALNSEAAEYRQVYTELGDFLGRYLTLTSSTYPEAH